MKGKNSMVSVLTAVYNGELFLSKTIECILKQTYSDIELLMIDDCSNDNSLSIIKEYAKKDKRIRYFVNKNNIGVDRSMNILINNAIGDYLLILDQDDLIDKNHIEKMINYMKPGVAAVYCDYVKINSNDEIISEKKHCHQNEFEIKDMVKFNPVPVIGILLNKQIVLDSGCYTEFKEFLHYGEWYLWIKMVERGRFVMCEDAVAKYRRHDFNISKEFETRKKHVSKFYRLCQKRALSSKKLSLKYKIKYFILLTYRNIAETNI